MKTILGTFEKSILEEKNLEGLTCQIFHEKGSMELKKKIAKSEEVDLKMKVTLNEEKTEIFYSIQYDDTKWDTTKRVKEVSGKFDIIDKGEGYISIEENTTAEILPFRKCG